MAAPFWQAGTLYLPGDLVQPVTQPPPNNPQVVNGGFSSGATGWTFDGDVAYTPTDGYGGGASVRLPGNKPDGVATNNTMLVVPVGSQLVATSMINQGASVAGATAGWTEIMWFDSLNTLLRTDKGNVVDSGSGGAWHQSKVTATAPAFTAYAKAAIHLTSVADHNHPIWGDTLAVSGATAGLPEGLVYKAVQAESGTSGSGEPAWPGILGQQVIDNEVIWEAVATSRITWTASPRYVSGGAEPVWPTDIGGMVRDGTINWRAISRRVEDPKCPNTKAVAIQASKVFAVDKDIVPFCATANPLDWSTEDDAGYLPTGLQQANSNDMAVLAPYRANLTAMNASSFQNWQVDPDPASMAILDQMDGIGSTWPKAAIPVGNDLFYLAQLGVRTIGIANAAENLASGDVGAPVDSLVREAMALCKQNGGKIVGTYYPGAGQYWLSMSEVPGPVETNVIPGVIGTSVTNTLTIAGSYRSAYIFPRKAGGIGAVHADDQLSAGGEFGYQHYDYLLSADGLPEVLVWVGASIGDQRLYLRSMNEGRVGITADDQYGLCKRILGGAYTGYFQPQGETQTWWFGEEGYAPEYGGLVWMTDEEVYIGVRMTSQANNVIYRFPLFPAGEAVVQTAVVQGVGTATNPRFWMTRSRDGGIFVITQDGRFQRFDENLSLMEDREFGMTIAGLRGFGVDGETICVVYASVAGGASAGAQFAKISNWSLVGSRILHGSMDGNEATRVLFDDQSCYVQCRNWVGRIEYRPDRKIYSHSSTVFVYTMVGSGKSGAWSRYLLPFSVDAFAQLGNDLYVRHGDEISVVTDLVSSDDAGDLAIPFGGTVWWNYLDFGTPGVTKMMEGFDIVSSGSPSISIGYDQRDLSAYTDSYAVDADTLPGAVIPFPMAAPTFSLRVDFAPGEKWSLQQAALSFIDLGNGP